MVCHNLILVVTCGFICIHQMYSVCGQALECNLMYAVTPNATCWRPFPDVPMDDCSHKFCYELSEGTAKCSHPWKKSTVHREHELERIATLARNQFVTQQSCTMKLKVNKNPTSNLHFFQHEDDCLGLDTFTLTHDSCAVVHLDRALRGYCIWYHNVCPKVSTDITVCKRDKDVEISTNSPRQAITEGQLDKSSFRIEIIIIVAVSANFLILIVVALLVSFLLKRFRTTTNRNDTLTRNKSNRPLPRVPSETTKADSPEFDKWKDENNYMYLSHESLDVPRYHTITGNDVSKVTGLDYSYPDLEKVKQSIDVTSDKSSYMALMKNDKDKPTTKATPTISEKSTISDAIDNLTPNSVVKEEDTATHALSDVDCTADGVNHQDNKHISYSDPAGDYSELKADYYVLEENDTGTSDTVCNDNATEMCSDSKTFDQDVACAQEEDSNHDYFQLENNESETEAIMKPEKLDEQ